MGADIKKYVIAAGRGDAEAFGELYALYKNEMFRYACIVVGNPVAAEDAVSEAVIEAFENIGTLRSPSSFKGWPSAAGASQAGARGARMAYSIRRYRSRDPLRIQVFGPLYRNPEFRLSFVDPHTDGQNADRYQFLYLPSDQLRNRCVPGRDPCTEESV